MIRKSPFAACAALLGVMAVGAANAAVVESNHISFTDKATPLAFNFAGSPELAAIKSGSTLVGIESYWTFTPGSGQSGSIDLLASLYSPSFASGVDTKVGFSTTVDGPTTASSTYASQQGLTFSSQVIQALLGGDTPGVLATELVGAGAGFSNLDTFFENGGTAEGYIKLITKDPRNPPPPPPGGGGGDPPPNPGGDPVPEPASMLVWGGLAACAWANRRRKRTTEQLAA